jgi:hypothetical protein
MWLETIHDRSRVPARIALLPGGQGVGFIPNRWLASSAAS